MKNKQFKFIHKIEHFGAEFITNQYARLVVSGYRYHYYHYLIK